MSVNNFKIVVSNDSYFCEKCGVSYNIGNPYYCSNCIPSNYYDLED